MAGKKNKNKKIQNDNDSASGLLWQSDEDNTNRKCIQEIKAVIFLPFTFPVFIKIKIYKTEKQKKKKRKWFENGKIITQKRNFA